MRMLIGQFGGRVSVHSRFPHFSRNEIQRLFRNFPMTVTFFNYYRLVICRNINVLFYNEILSKLLYNKLQCSLFIFQIYMQTVCFGTVYYPICTVENMDRWITSNRELMKNYRIPLCFSNQKPQKHRKTNKQTDKISGNLIFQAH